MLNIVLVRYYESKVFVEINFLHRNKIVVMEPKNFVATLVKKLLSFAVVFVHVIAILIFILSFNSYKV
jgi:hypothetical protein